jgi:hypothetical protein
LPPETLVLIQLANLPPVSTKPSANLMLVTTGGKIATSINDTSGKFATVNTGVVDTDGKVATGVNDILGKFVTSVNTTVGK